MSAAVVVCPACEQPSRVPITALGLVVACPRCQHQFVAVALTPASPPPPVRPLRVVPRDDIPVVHRLPRPSPPRDEDDIPTVHPQQTTGGPFAVALLPVGVPLLWLVLSVTVGSSEFSFVAAVAIAAGTSGLGLGLASIRRWSARLRMRLLVALAALGYVAAALFYFATPDWLVQVREVAAVMGLSWGVFQPEDKSFRLDVPGDPAETSPPVPGWKLSARQFVDPRHAVDLYVVAYGDLPTALGARGGNDADPGHVAWFERARDAIAAACDGRLQDERVVSVSNCHAREYVFALGDGKQRVVRVVRTEKKLYYLGVEGPFLTADRTDVRKYLQSFKLTPPKRR